MKLEQPSPAEQWGPQDVENVVNVGHSPFRPRVIKAVISDLDGTVTGSYKIFLAADAVSRTLIEFGCDQVQVSTFIKEYLGGKRPVGQKKLDVQDLLHLSGTTREALRQFGLDHNVRHHTEHPEIGRLIGKYRQQSYSLYPGFMECLNNVNASGAFFGIYTASPGRYAIGRIDASGIQANQINALWARQRADAGLGFLGESTATQNSRELGNLYIPCAFKKPNAMPMEQLAEYGIKSEEILYIGEGKNDLLSVYLNPAKPSAVFAFQEQGARDICEKQKEVNELIRPGSEELGADPVNKKIRELGIEREVIRLTRGFETLNEFVNQGKIVFAAPDIMPIVHRHSLQSQSFTHYENAQNASAPL